MTTTIVHPDVTVLGPFTRGEIPEPVVVTFLNAAGQPVNLTGYTARWTIRFPDGTGVERAASLSATPTDGTATYVWQATDMDVAGPYRGQMWVGNGVNRYPSRPYVWVVTAATTVTTPAV